MGSRNTSDGPFPSNPNSSFSNTTSYPIQTWNASSLLNPRTLTQTPQKPKDPNNYAENQKLLFHFDGPGNSQLDSGGSTLQNPAVKPDHGFAAYANSPRDAFGTGPVGSMGSMLERVHNVTNRDVLPQKRRKIESEQDEKKAEFNGVNSSGVLGEYFKEKKEDKNDLLINKTPRIDLSSVDDEDVVLIGDGQDKEVCYGRIEGVELNSFKVPTPKPGAVAISSGFWPQVKIILRRRVGDRTNVIHAVDSTRTIIGCVDVNTAIGLVPLLDSKFNIRTASRILTRTKKDTDQPPGSDVSCRYGLDVNLYGPKKYALQVGTHLSQKQLWLRTPLFVETGIELFNPHSIQKPAQPASKASTSYASRVQGPQRTTEEIRNDVLGMFDSLVKSENLPEMQPDSRITTELLRHQKQGLHFMTGKEKDRVFGEDEKDNSSLWRLSIASNGAKSYYNVITGDVERDSPPEVLGGILADMMGLGKTLSILSLVVGSLEAAEEWSKTPLVPLDDMARAQPTKKNQQNFQAAKTEQAKLVQKSKTTLLISPLSTIANWEEQIKQHIKPKTLKYYIYHGTNRIKDIQKLCEYDIVITTYGSVASEFACRNRKKGGIYPLEQIQWFRIVLDEAHMIREQSTQQSKAVCRLAAQRRWAVTGTPVQNRLEDLGALMAFLRIKPFDEKGGFAQYIMAPFKMCDPEILPKLRLLVDSITLRRLKDRIDLPPRQDHLVYLDFSEEENTIYQIFAQNANDRVKVITGQREKSLGGKAYVHILQSILRLRLVCAHGKDLLNEEDLKVLDGLSKENAIDLDSDDEEDRSGLTPKQAYDMYNLMKETGADVCSTCSRRIGTNEPADPDTDIKCDIFGYMTPCYHIICNTCIGGYKKTLEEAAMGQAQLDCPICQQLTSLSYFALRQEGVEDEENSRLDRSQKTKGKKTLDSYSGPHTKTKALIQDLLLSEVETARQPPSEPPIKSVIFSGWTHHLDLIQLALDTNGLTYTRLDGKMSRAARSAALETFREDPGVHIMLVSISAGGLGLNLTTANKVYVMEPQYNPAAEAQAIDRVHRLGQRRPVRTVRYVMRGSFEEKMLELQDKKMKLASLSMDSSGARMDKVEAARRRLEDLRSLFR